MEIPSAPEDFSPHFINDFFLPALEKEALALTVTVPGHTVIAMAESVEWSFLNFGKPTPPSDSEMAQKQDIESSIDITYIVRSQVEFFTKGIIKFSYQDEENQDCSLEYACDAEGLIRYHCDHTPDLKLWIDDCEIVDRTFTFS